MNDKTLKENLLQELRERFDKNIISEGNYNLFKKLITNADSDTEAISIMELGTIRKRTGFHFNVQLEKFGDRIKYFQKNNDLSFINDENRLTHKLIIGDNYDALLNLKIQYTNKIDIIYIDPPYGKDSVGESAKTNYKNDITRDELLSMLYPRLLLAKQLLTDEGVIFCSIDDKNQAYVKGLFDEVFGESNFITNFTWIASKKEYNEELFDNKNVPVLGSNLGNFKSAYEYVLCYSKTKNFKFNLIKSKENMYIDSRITNADNNISILTLPKGLNIKNKKNIIFKNKIGGESEPIEILNEEGMIFKDGCLYNDVKLKSCFRNPNIIKKYLANEEVYDNKNQKIIDLYFTQTGVPYTRKLKAGEIPVNVLTGYGDTSNSLTLLKNILKNNSFNYPKPVKLIKHIINLHSNKSATVLDFYAGSGTTGQAVMDLNKEDGGNRTFILCTNNENNIAINVTSKRLKRIMSGECYDGFKNYKWLDDNKPYMDNLEVYDIKEISNNIFMKDKTAFDVIDESLYGVPKFNNFQDKIDWICRNFENTQKYLEN